MITLRFTGLLRKATHICDDAYEGEAYTPISFSITCCSGHISEGESVYSLLLSLYDSIKGR